MLGKVFGRSSAIPCYLQLTDHLSNDGSYHVPQSGPDGSTDHVPQSVPDGCTDPVSNEFTYSISHSGADSSANAQAKNLRGALNIRQHNVRHVDGVP